MGKRDILAGIAGLLGFVLIFIFIYFILGWALNI